jgi:hypothetical protein
LESPDAGILFGNPGRSLHGQGEVMLLLNFETEKVPESNLCNYSFIYKFSYGCLVLPLKFSPYYMECLVTN